MPIYQIYDDDGVILRTVNCPENMIDSQVIIGHEFYVEGQGNDQDHKIIGDEIIKKTDGEKADELFERRKGTSPRIGPDLNDEEVDLIISEYFLGRIDVGKWRIENYGLLRKRAYPDTAGYLDGIVKGDQDQIDKYRAECMAVKKRFPKE